MGKYYNNRPTSKLEQIRDSALKIHDRIDPGHDIISHDEGEPGYYNDRPKTKLETIRDAAECIAQITEKPTGEYQYEELRNVDVASFISEVTATIKKLTVGIEPVQDLHGYDAPWPSGGGKNKANYPLMISAGAVEQSDGSLYVEKAITFSNVSAWQNDGSAGQFAITFILKNDGTSRGIYPVVKYTDNTEESIPINAGVTAFTTFTKITNNSKTVDSVYFKYGSSNVKSWFYIQIESGSTVTSWAPYSNICPITGRTGANIYVSPTDDPADGRTYSVTFPTEAGTVYGGTLDVTSGVLTVDRAMIASYAGEALPSGWISDRDVYAAGTAPTTGAQVVYELASPITYQLTPQQITTLLGENNVWADTGGVKNIKYPYAEK